MHRGGGAGICIVIYNENELDGKPAFGMVIENKFNNI